jgi:hypothetical protein
MVSLSESVSEHFRHAVLPVAKRDDFREVVAGVDVQERKRKGPGPKGLFRQSKQYQRILAPGEQQRRRTALAGDLAQDVNGLGFEPAEMMRIGAALRGGLTVQCPHIKLRFEMRRRSYLLPGGLDTHGDG